MFDLWVVMKKRDLVKTALFNNLMGIIKATALRIMFFALFAPAETKCFSERSFKLDFFSFPNRTTQLPHKLTCNDCIAVNRRNSNPHECRGPRPSLTFCVLQQPKCSKNETNREKTSSFLWLKHWSIWINLQRCPILVLEGHCLAGFPCSSALTHPIQRMKYCTSSSSAAAY